MIQAELNPGYFNRKRVDTQAILKSFRDSNYEIVRFDPSGKFITATGAEHRQLHQDIYLIPKEKLDLVLS